MSNTALHQFPCRGWNASIRLERAHVEGPIAGRADLRFGANRAHRIVVDEPYRASGAALRQLAQRAQPLPSHAAARAHH